MTCDARWRGRNCYVRRRGHSCELRQRCRLVGDLIETASVIGTRDNAAMVKRRSSTSVLPAFDAPIPSPQERRLAGKGRRSVVPRKAHALWEPPTDRRDPIEVLVESNRAPCPRAGSTAICPDERVAVRLPAWVCAHHGVRPRVGAVNRSRGAAVRRRGHVELRGLRQSGATADVRSQRLRRSLARPIRVGREATCGEHRRGRSRQRLRPRGDTTGRARCRGCLSRLDGTVRQHDTSRCVVRQDRDARPVGHHGQHRTQGDVARSREPRTRTI